MSIALANPDMVALAYTALRTIVAGFLVETRPCRRQLDFALCILGVNGYVCDRRMWHLIFAEHSQVRNLHVPLLHPTHWDLI